MRFISENQGETEDYGRKLGKTLSPGDTVVLSGPLGAGKTAFARGICRALGYKDDVTSPTFTLANIYDADMHVVHFDLYRIQNAGPESLEDIGFYDAFDGKSLVLIEWADSFLEEIFGAYTTVDIQYGDTPHQRIIHIEGGKESAAFH